MKAGQHGGRGSEEASEKGTKGYSLHASMNVFEQDDDKHATDGAAKAGQGGAGEGLGRKSSSKPESRVDSFLSRKATRRTALTLQS